MAQEIQVKTICDVCQKKYGTKVDAEPYPRLSIGRLVRDADLCPDCRKVPDAFRAWMLEYGQKIDPAAEKNAAPGPRTSPPRPLDVDTSNVCLHPKCKGTRPLKNIASLRAHIRTEHGMTYHQLGRQAEAAGLIPIDPNRPPLLTCDVRVDGKICGVPQDGPHSLAMHQAKAHPKARGTRPVNGRRQKSEVVS